VSESCPSHVRCPRHVRILSKSCPSQVRVMSESCLSLRVISESYPSHIRVMSEQCPSHVRVMSESCPNHVRVGDLCDVRVSELCPSHVRDSELCPSHVFSEQVSNTLAACPSPSPRPLKQVRQGQTLGPSAAGRPKRRAPQLLNGPGRVLVSLSLSRPRLPCTLLSLHWPAREPAGPASRAVVGTGHGSQLGGPTRARARSGRGGGVLG
jgi:hypothetical protein